ncbi:SMI1/KNR4 family protein [Bacillus sp. COPE52]|uniref:SMI1/KNR4 family protein n=1 Tax=Bacillus sp. COPE52 TaxID=2233998 RepID=UPI000E109CED|nr:SMI1/KNR4 family protein [Bacillus sp. COPE52]AXK16700.1 SMI1/KNR4 family protein [Bacillus sp. COPE52]
MKEWIANIFSEREEKGDFFGGVEDEFINQLEKRLDCKFPDNYRWFLKHYGGGGILGIDLTCAGYIDNSPILSETGVHRKMGLPNSYVVIWDVGEYVYCLDTSSLVNSECPVVTWDFVSKKTVLEAKDFYEFLSRKLKSAIEDYED